MILPIPPPSDFDFDWLVRFLAARRVPSLESVVDGEYRRSVRWEGRPVVLSVRLGEEGTALEVRTAPALDAAETRRLVARMFDLEVDLAPFRAMAASDPVLRELVARRPGIRLPQLLDPLEGMARAILGQQVSLAAAATMLDRIVRLFAEPAPPPHGEALLVFPPAASIAEAGPARLAGVGLTRAKATALWSLAEALVTGRLDPLALRAAPPEAAQAALVELPGIGPWTASYIRMRTLGDRDAFPFSDLGLLKALSSRPGEKIAPAASAAQGERWRPWRAYATLHLWNSLGGN